MNYWKRIKYIFEGKYTTSAEGKISSEAKLIKKRKKSYENTLEGEIDENTKIVEQSTNTQLAKKAKVFRGNWVVICFVRKIKFSRIYHWWCTWEYI